MKKRMDLLDNYDRLVSYYQSHGVPAFCFICVISAIPRIILFESLGSSNSREI